MRLFRITVFVVLCALPYFAHAKSTVEWDFRGKIPARFEVRNLTPPIPTPEGLRIQTKTDGNLRTAIDFPFGIEAIVIELDSDVPTEALLLWHENGSPEDVFVQLPFIIDGTGEQTLEINVRKFAQWDSHTDELGIAFPAGTDVLLQKIAFHHWNILEKLREAFLGLWTFEHRRSHTINFVWGPLLVFSPIARQQLFNTLKPAAFSINWVIYATLFLSGTTLFFLRRRIAKPLPLFFVIFAILWVAYDVRMTTEFAWQATQDYALYMEGSGTETRKEFVQLQHIAKTLPGLLGDAQEYVLLTDNPRVRSYLRYEIYPRITRSASDISNERYWLVYKDSSISINTEQRLTRDGETLSSPGFVHETLADNIFLFEIF